ncbi:sigma-70 family RNA polymerase sigma factor [Gracilibacillus caseinilyticus]|uniref:Sigma-70 family RNA polymerase sigma factor n=1 Tax=Gracilibacillus caseinilyticus TaxID=2932256 RepID=A0ABY4F0I5_9BACI|nr:sigma-70 family RNA polymerase sigma factor [Gracilibacillus caseinilyticus]UOQ49409.1 sigma-70 family RNA polymerase sigma factor [Gracilibacillus caseinilyticus]
MTKNENVAEDILQDLFTRILFNPENIFKVTYTRSWLLTCAKNAFLDYYKKKKPVLLNDEELIEQLLIEPTSTEKEVLVNHQLETLLNTLDPIDKAIILAKEYYGYSYLEMEHLFNLTTPNLKSKVFRIKKRLVKMEVKK